MRAMADAEVSALRMVKLSDSDGVTVALLALGLAAFIGAFTIRPGAQGWVGEPGATFVSGALLSSFALLLSLVVLRLVRKFRRGKRVLATEPRLEIIPQLPPPKVFHQASGSGLVDTHPPKSGRRFVGYRVRVKNVPGDSPDAARNCKPRLLFGDDQQDIAWVGSSAEVDINPDAEELVDLCAVNEETGEVIAPNERSYFAEGPLDYVRLPHPPFEAELQVNSANRRPARCQVKVGRAVGGGLSVDIVSVALDSPSKSQARTPPPWRRLRVLG